jgi:two-component system sensor histidine kinase ChvG
MRRQPALARRVSPLMLRIMAVNVLALAMLLGGLLYLDQFRNNLIDARSRELNIQAQIIAGAIGEAATGEAEAAEINVRLARQILARLVVPAEIRGRLFALDGRLLADSRNLGRHVHVVKLPSKTVLREATTWLEGAYDYLRGAVGRKHHLPVYHERFEQRARDYPETRQALKGEPGSSLRTTAEQNNLVISVAVPVQRFKRVLGALMLTTDTVEIDDLVKHERLLIIKIFAVTMVITLLLSIFLARTIVRPIHQLAAAADKVRMGGGREISIPDFSGRGDELGDLSVAFDEMMKALYLQMDAVAAFAADVSHEMKNPLSSLRSAVESVEKSRDPAVKARLMAIIQDDVKRLDRLISDISEASRLDAELSRAKMEPVDLTTLLQAVAEVYDATKKPDMPALKLELPVDLESGVGAGPEAVVVNGVPGRLGQVVRNLLDNAVSFSPPGGEIRIILKKYRNYAQIEVLDQGPGIPEGKLEDIFLRFYTERPAAEAFGKHSGLGLNISRQIVLAYEGEIFAENRKAEDGVEGARFVVRLPV